MIKMPTRETTINFLNKAVLDQLEYNIELYSFYKDDEETQSVILEEMEEVKEAYQDFNKCFMLLYSLKPENLARIKEKTFHLIEECVHVISAIDKIHAISAIDEIYESEVQ